VFQGGSQVDKVRGRNPAGSTEPDHWSPNLRISVEVKNYEMAHPKYGYRALVENLAGNERSPGQMVVRAHNMPHGTKHWLFVDVRGQNIGDVREFSQSLRRDLGSRNIFSKVFFNTDQGVRIFRW